MKLLAMIKNDAERLKAKQVDLIENAFEEMTRKLIERRNDLVNEMS